MLARHLLADSVYWMSVGGITMENINRMMIIMMEEKCSRLVVHVLCLCYFSGFCLFKEQLKRLSDYYEEKNLKAVFKKNMT